ncbi:hypothetical protein OAK75_01435 [Bacteriovoracales bacterium]|nr:hypothetical protein [Bacteriovoracales bacterium]
MGQNLISRALSSTENIIIGYSLSELIIILFHSFAIGASLCIVTYFTSRSLLKDAKGPSEEKIELILGTVNIMYLCTGMTSVMILVNNNLARAFAIGAAIALIRFRIKLSRNMSNSNVLFSIVCGIACGLNEVGLAWLSTGAYFLITILLWIITGSIHNKIPKD